MFFTHHPDWDRAGATAVSELQRRFAQDGLEAENFALVALRESAGAAGPVLDGFAYRGDWRCYPCSLVKTFHLVHAIAALEAGRIAPHAEFDRAMRDMILWSSNTGTNYVIDLLTETTGDTLLSGAAFDTWVAAREGLNRGFTALDWPEFASCNLAQKLMDDQRYGREAQFAALHGGYLNALTPLATARLMAAIFTGDLPLSPEGLRRARQTLLRDRNSADAASPHFQVSEFLGGHLPDEARIWSKAGHNLWTGDAKASWFKHDMIRIEAPGLLPMSFVLMTQGKRIASDIPDAFPRIGRFLFEHFAPAARVGVPA